VKLYSFDVNGEQLEQLPLAARRALDHAGWKLSLAGWTSLSLADRQALARLGSERVVDVLEVARRAQSATPPAARCEITPDPARDAPPEPVVEAFAAEGSLSRAIWAALDDLDRYALCKVASRSDAERKHAAYAEIVGHRQISTHLAPRGGVEMVNVGAKAVTERRAQAESRVSMNRAAFELLARHAAPKGDVLGTARIAGILAAKRTAELIPLCHALPLSHVGIDLELEPATYAVRILASVETQAKTGVEMEALVAASTAALTVYDMLKAADRAMQIGPTRVLSKSGGVSGDFHAASAPTSSGAPTAIPSREGE
jgi:cyclic pyranopterin phosphate synthase